MSGALVALLLLFALLLFGIPLGWGMGLVGTVAFGLSVGWSGALALVGQVATDTALNYNLSVLPLFVLMGSLFAHSRMADELYEAAYAWLGHLRGGLAMSTILACGAFSAVSGSAMACAATMTRVAVPTMRRYGYQSGFAAGTVAAGATLDILIPPSIAMVIFAVITDTNLGQLMAAGFLPGLITIICYIAMIALVTWWKPKLAPAGGRSGWPARLRALLGVWPLALLFMLVLGTVYAGLATPNEAAGLGALGAFLLAWLRGRLSWAVLARVLIETARVTSVMYIVLVGALLFANYVTVSGAATALEHWVGGMQLPPTALIVALLGIYLVLGSILEANAMILLTVPIFFPIIVKAGIDPIWFGTFVVIVSGIGLIHPPMGLLLYVVKSLVPDLRIADMFYGVLPYLVGDAVRLSIFIAFPGVVLWLPHLMAKP